MDEDVAEVRARNRATPSFLEVSPLDAALRDLVADEPTPARLYQVQFGDRPVDLARAMLWRSAGIAKPTAAQVDAYMHLLAAGVYNSELYGTQCTSRVYPSRWLVPGLGRGIRVAWLPRNADVLDQLLAGESAMCNVDRRTGTALGASTARGLVWCVPVELVDGEITTEPFCYPDGASALDPPLPILQALNP